MAKPKINRGSGDVSADIGSKDEDEAFARQLLVNYLTAHGMSGCTCEINENDPPDLIVTLENGERWGVEVTRTYQRVVPIGKPNDTGSSESNIAKLQKFALELQEKTKGDRGLNYNIYFRMPDVFNEWKKQDISQKEWEQWKKEISKSVTEYIKSGNTKPHKFFGGSLFPHGPGNNWGILIGGQTAVIEPAIATMLEHALQEKTKGLSRWGGGFSKRWLLLLNCYVYASDITCVENALHQLVRDNPALTGFEDIFWSGYPDRELGRINLTEI